MTKGGVGTDQLIITLLKEGLDVDLPDSVFAVALHNEAHGLLHDINGLPVHSPVLHRVLYESLVYRQTLKRDCFFELLHVFFKCNIRPVHEEGGEKRHFDVIEIAQTPLDAGVGEYVVEALGDLPLDVDRLVLVDEIDHIVGQGLRRIRRYNCLL